MGCLRHRCDVLYVCTTTPRDQTGRCGLSLGELAARSKGVLAVEMEAAALYAFAQARGRAVLCLAYVTNTMAQARDDFEKGEDNGARKRSGSSLPLPQSTRPWTLTRLRLLGRRSRSSVTSPRAG